MMPATRGAILVIDSIGERDATTMWETSSDGGKVRLDIRLQNPDPHSLGYVYASVTEYLGYGRGDEEGTVMALAAHGDPQRFRELMADAIWLVDGGVMVNPTYFLPRTLLPGAERLSDRFKLETRDVTTSDHASQESADLAAALQERIELAVVHLSRIACSVVGTDRLTIAGGVAMNCVAMGRVAELGEVRDLRVPPAPGDAGTALGAALLSSEAGITPAATSFALGPSCSNDDLFAAESRLAPHVSASSQATPERVAALLARGDIVGLCRGPVEFGPRALGNRSILANPLVDSVTAILNSRVKHREAFRPYAPAIPREMADDWFELQVASPYMSIASKARPITREVAPEVVHRNGRCRVQTVDEGRSPFFSAVLQEFFRLTGVPMLINTSLNVKGRPMSGTASMAVDCFIAGSIDAICLGERLYERR
jgi:carbamoyltransferase